MTRSTPVRLLVLLEREWRACRARRSRSPKMTEGTWSRTAWYCTTSSARPTMNCGSPTRAGDVVHFPREHPALKTAPFVGSPASSGTWRCARRGARAAGYTAEMVDHIDALPSDRGESATRASTCSVVAATPPTACRARESRAPASPDTIASSPTHSLEVCARAHRQTACWRTPPRPG